MLLTFVTSKFVYMAVIKVLLLTILFTSATGLRIERNHARRFLFGGHKTSTISTTTEEATSGQSFSKWLNGFLSGDAEKEKQSDSFSKLALLKNFLSSSSSSSSSSDKSSKIDKLFQILTNSAADDKNESSSSSSKLNRLLGFFNSHGSSSSNLELAMKLMNLSQGKSGLSSLSISDMKSLLKFVG